MLTSNIGSVGPDTFCRGAKTKTFLVFLVAVVMVGGKIRAHNELRRPKAKKRIKPVKSKSLAEIKASSWAGVWTHRKQRYDFRINNEQVCLVCIDGTLSHGTNLVKQQLIIFPMTVWGSRVLYDCVALTSAAPTVRLWSGHHLSPAGVWTSFALRAPAMQQSWSMGGGGVVLVVCERFREGVERGVREDSRENRGGIRSMNGEEKKTCWDCCCDILWIFFFREKNP